MKALAAAIVLILVSLSVEALECGSYRVTGRLECRPAGCMLTAYPGSQSETRLWLETLKLRGTGFIAYNHKMIRAKIQITSTRADKTGAVAAKPLDSIPLRALASFGKDDFELLKAEPCVP